MARKYIGTSGTILPSIGSYRTWDSGIGGWDTIEPNPPVAGVPQYDWTTLDQLVANANAANIQVLFEIGRVPTWASSEPTIPACSGTQANCCSYGAGLCAPPCDLQPGTSCASDGYSSTTVCSDGSTGNCHFKDFMAALTTRYAGKIVAYELWNEPNGRNYWFSGTWNGQTMAYNQTLAASNLVAMTHDAFTVIRKQDPHALIVSPSALYLNGRTASVNSFIGGYFGSWLQAGYPLFDVIGFHYYDTIQGQTYLPEAVVPGLSTLGPTLAQRPELASLPIWNTEGSFGTGSLFTTAEQAGYVARRAVLLWANGVTRFFWYAFDGQGLGSLVNSTGTALNEAGVAYEQTYSWLAGASMIGPCAVTGPSPTSATYECPITRPNGYAGKIVWSSGETCNLASNTCTTTAYTPDPIYVQYRDLSGNVVPINSSIQIGVSPLLLEN
jgi:hypothetical protein